MINTNICSRFHFLLPFYKVPVTLHYHCLLCTADVIVVTTSFFLVYIPMAILRNIDPDAMITQRKSFIFCYLCTCMIGIIDPLVYIIFQESYRNEIKDMIKNVMFIKRTLNVNETKNWIHVRKDTIFWFLQDVNHMFITIVKQYHMK